MLRRIQGLPRLPQRFALLPLAHFAASGPTSLDYAATRARLHVFARLPNDDPTKVAVSDSADAGDLKNAVIAELKLETPPGRICLLREVGGDGALLLLDSCRGLSEQGVREGTRVVVEVLPPPQVAGQHALASKPRQCSACCAWSCRIRL